MGAHLFDINRFNLLYGHHKLGHVLPFQKPDLQLGKRHRSIFCPECRRKRQSLRDIQFLHSGGDRSHNLMGSPMVHLTQVNRQGNRACLKDSYTCSFCDNGRHRHIRIDASGSRNRNRCTHPSKLEPAF